MILSIQLKAKLLYIPGQVLSEKDNRVTEIYHRSENKITAELANITRKI